MAFPVPMMRNASSGGASQLMLYQPTSSSAGNLIILQWNTGTTSWDSIATLAVSDFGGVNIQGLAAVSGTRVCAAGAAKLRMYDWDESTTIAATGSDGTAGSGSTRVAALGAGTIIAAGSGGFPTYSGFEEFDFSGTFSSASNQFTYGFGSTGAPNPAGLSSTKMAVIGDNSKLGQFSLSGSTWALDGTELTISATENKAIDSFTQSRVVVAFTGTTMQAYDRGATAYATVGSAFAGYGGTLYDACSLSATQMVQVYREGGAVKVSPPITFNDSTWSTDSGTPYSLTDSALRHVITCMSFLIPRAA